MLELLAALTPGQRATLQAILSGDAPQGASPNLSQLAKSAAIETLNQVGLFRRSAEPFDDSAPFNPENYDVRGEADKAARRNGHTLSVWLPAPPDTTRQPVEPPPKDFWHAKCLTCGAFAFARWLPTGRNDPYHASSTASGPAFGGDAIQKTEEQCTRKSPDNDRQAFSPRTDPRLAGLVGGR